MNEPHDVAFDRLNAVIDTGLVAIDKIDRGSRILIPGNN